jgi:hypothetical protein
MFGYKFGYNIQVYQYNENYIILALNPQIETVTSDCFAVVQGITETKINSNHVTVCE